MISNRLDTIVAGGLLVAIAFTAVAQGAVEPWSVAIFELIIIFLCLIWSIKAALDKRFEMVVPITAFPIAAFFIYGFIQSISFIDREGVLQSLSIDPETTRTTVTTLFFLLTAHVIAASFFKTEDRLKTLTSFLMIFGVLLSVLGLLQLVAGNGSILWFRPIVHSPEWLTGPFVNHNHFAGYMELIIPIPVAMIIIGTQKEYRILYVFAALIMAVALVLTASRGGIISLTAALLFTVLLSVSFKSRSQISGRGDDATGYKGRMRPLLSGIAILGVILAAIFAGAAWIGLDPLVDRVSDGSVESPRVKAESFEMTRGAIWATSVRMAQANPILGIGVGAYETAYPKYSDRNDSLIVDRAHNDYLQVLSDTGIIGGLCALLFLLAFIYNVIRIFRVDDPLKGAIAIGFSAAIFSILVHSVFDFNLQLPSNALLFLVLNAVLSNISALQIGSENGSGRRRAGLNKEAASAA